MSALPATVEPESTVLAKSLRTVARQPVEPAGPLFVNVHGAVAAVRCDTKTNGRTARLTTTTLTGHNLNLRSTPSPANPEGTWVWPRRSQKPKTTS